MEQFPFPGEVMGLGPETGDPVIVLGAFRPGPITGAPVMWTLTRYRARTLRRKRRPQQYR